MPTISLRGTMVETAGDLPSVGSAAPDFRLVGTDLSEISLADFRGKKLVLNIYPSIDTPTCAKSVRVFNEQLSKCENTVVLCVSADLPFAQTRFCGAEGLERVMPASTFRYPDFGRAYGAEMVDGPLQGLLSRAVVVIDENGQVVHAEQVMEIVEEPDYEAALRNI